WRCRNGSRAACRGPDRCSRAALARRNAYGRAERLQSRHCTSRARPRNRKRDPCANRNFMTGCRSMSAIIRKIVTVVEETYSEMGRTVTPPSRRASAIAVIENPFAGRYVEDLTPLIEIGEELGELLARRAVTALGIEGAKAQSYGKAAAVGENGELEHAAAILHPKMGAPVRKVLGKGAAL